MRTSLRLRPLPLLAPSSSGALCLHLDQQDSRGVNAAPEPVVEFTRPMLLERRRRFAHGPVGDLVAFGVRQ